jgi:hypothetical protein
MLLIRYSKQQECSPEKAFNGELNGSRNLWHFVNLISDQTFSAISICQPFVPQNST